MQVEIRETTALLTPSKSETIKQVALYLKGARVERVKMDKLGRLHITVEAEKGASGV
jgi:hypothetical protein